MYEASAASVWTHGTNINFCNSLGHPAFQLQPNTSFRRITMTFAPISGTTRQQKTANITSNIHLKSGDVSEEEEDYTQIHVHCVAAHPL